MQIEVTHRDIAGGVRGDSDYCPVALALKRGIGRGYGAWAGRVTWCYHEADGTKRSGNLPPEARKFIRRFDGGKPVAPIAFEIG